MKKENKVNVKMFETKDGLYLGRYDITSDGYWMYRKEITGLGMSTKWVSCYTWFECNAAKNILNKELRIEAFPN